MTKAKAKKTEDLKAKTPDELQKMLLDTRKEQMNLRFQRSGGQLENVSMMRKVRRNIARIKTFMNMNKKQDAKAAPAKAAKQAAAPKKAKAKKEAA